jgi:hypothetical protein
MPTSIDADRRRVAAYLAEHGTTRGPALRAALDWGDARFWAAVFGPANGWFAVTPDGWNLTRREKRRSP